MPRILLSIFALAGLAACSSAVGGGYSSPDRTYIVVPPGQMLVCLDGTAPPCR